MEQEGQKRQEVGQALLVLAVNDPNFLNRIRNDPASTLSSYGLTLRDPEMDEVFRYLIDNAGSTDEEIIGELRSRMEVELKWF